jgi:hypothetical protein
MHTGSILGFYGLGAGDNYHEASERLEKARPRGRTQTILGTATTQALDTFGCRVPNLAPAPLPPPPHPGPKTCMHMHMHMHSIWCTHRIAPRDTQALHMVHRDSPHVMHMHSIWCTHRPTHVIHMHPIWCTHGLAPPVMHTTQTGSGVTKTPEGVALSTSCVTASSVYV